MTLTTQEFKLLKYSGGLRGRVVSREELLNEVWGYHNYPSTRTVDNHVLRFARSSNLTPRLPAF